MPVASSSYIAPFTCSITPSASYLADPLNAYAHLGMPKPFVHLMGPPLDVALDARVVGDQGRFARNGCRPNAVLRPVLCSKAKEGNDKERHKREAGKKHAENRDETDEDDDTLTFGVFALRDLKANEEVVLGWEWDDGNAVHSLPALIESPHMFSCVSFLAPLIFNPPFLFVSYWTVFDPIVRSRFPPFRHSSYPNPSCSLENHALT